MGYVDVDHASLFLSFGSGHVEGEHGLHEGKGTFLSWNVCFFSSKYMLREIVMVWLKLTLPPVMWTVSVETLSLPEWR